MNKLKVLVAGHTGFVGRSLLGNLESSKDIDLILMSKSSGHDLTIFDTVKNIKCDVIVNLAGFVSIEDGWINPLSMYKNNYLITLNLLELSRTVGASFIHISSYVYGVPEYQPIDEKHPEQSHNPYASVKLMLDNLCSDYCEYFKFPVTILRPFNLYGVGQDTNFLISGLINSIIKGKEIDIKDLNALRDYLWVGDFSIAIHEIILNQKMGLNLYNVGSGITYSALDLIRIIQNRIGIMVKYTQNNAEKILVQECCCDNKLFINTFNWKVDTSIEQGIDNIFKDLNL